MFFGAPGLRPTSALYLEIPDRRRETRGRRGLRTPTHTFVIERDERGQRATLHDNKKGPYQRVSVAEGSPALVAQLTKRLKERLAEIGDDP
ncbi:MAG: hypothetical protein ACE149_07470 [Armatimonadota bacterium]